MRLMTHAYLAAGPSLSPYLKPALIISTLQCARTVAGGTDPHAAMRTPQQEIAKQRPGVL